MNDESFATFLDRLKASKFRAKFKLSDKDKEYVKSKGLDVVREHAAGFVRTRLAPACPVNDGKQTPFKGHPVFVAQHATATCCRGCLEKWHGVAQRQVLDDEQMKYVVDVVMMWVAKECGG